MFSLLQRGQGPSLPLGLLLYLYLFLATVNAQEESSDTESQTECVRPTGNYNIGARVGAIFIVLCTSSIGMDSRGSSFTELPFQNVPILTCQHYSGFWTPPAFQTLNHQSYQSILYGHQTIWHWCYCRYRIYSRMFSYTLFSFTIHFILTLSTASR